MKSNRLKRWIVFIGLLFIILEPNSVVLGELSREEKQILRETEDSFKSVSDDELRDAVSLERLLVYAQVRNTKLRSAFYEWKASVYHITQSKSLEDPQVSFKFFIDETQTRVGPQEQMVSISQMFPFPGKLRAKSELATAVSRERFEQMSKIRLELYYEVKDVYFEYWYLYKQILVAEKSKILLEHFEGVAQSKYKSGLAQNQDLLKAQVELGKIENTLLTLNDYKMPVLARLNAVLNRNLYLSVGSPSDIEQAYFSMPLENLQKIFHENNFDLKSAAQRIEQATRKVQLAKLDYLPDFMLSYDYTRVGQRPVEMPDNGMDSSAVMLRINLPLWIAKNRTKLIEAQSRYNASTNDLEQLRYDLEAKLNMVHFKVMDAQRQMKLYQNALIPKAEQTLLASETAYSAGTVDFLHLIDSERTLLEFQLQYYKAVRDYEQRLAELEMIVGQTLRGDK